MFFSFSLFAKLHEKVLSHDSSHITCLSAWSLAVFFSSLLKQTPPKWPDGLMGAILSASSQSALQHFAARISSSLPFPWCLLLCPVLSAPHSPGLALLLLTSERWCPFQVLALSSVLALSPPFLCDSIHSQGFICHVWGWPSNLLLQAMLLTCIPNFYLAYRSSPMGCPKGYWNSVHPKRVPHSVLTPLHHQSFYHHPPMRRFRSIYEFSFPFCCSQRI